MKVVAVTGVGLGADWSLVYFVLGREPRLSERVTAIHTNN
jgi:hypothetical protein